MASTDTATGPADVCGVQHLVLVGMMGTGKSTVGRALAQYLQRPLLDSDELVEATTGRSVREIWATDGEPAFRALETAALAGALANDEPSVIAAAGGVVISAENRELLSVSDAHVVWLVASVEVLVDRVQNGSHRPALDSDPQTTLEQMSKQRSDWYQEVADAVVSVDHRSINDVAKAVLRCAG